MTSIPFSISNAHRGASEMRGTVCVDDDEVVVEMQVKLWSLFKRPPQTFRFDVTDLEEIRHKRSLLGDTVVLRTRPMDLAAQVPGSANGELTLKIKRSRRREVDALLDRLDLWVV